MAKSSIDVVVGLVYHANGDILLAKRQAGKHLAGYWEFPGGKIEHGETSLAALKRELCEELSIEVQSAELFMQLRHEYPKHWVNLFVYTVNSYHGEPQGAEGQAIRWQAPAQLDPEQLPLANLSIVERLRS